MNSANGAGGPLEKYLYKPFYGSSHSWAIRAGSALPKSSRVLDIGAGSGPLGRALGQAGFSELYAVEPDTRAREALTGLYRRVEAQVESFAGDSFDLVLLLDVLEHLTDPAAMLKHAAAALKTGGVLLVSVPNVAHWSIRLSLFAGSFRYTERGILDKTHVQFFTRKRIDELFRAESSLEISSRDSSIPPAEFVLPRPVWNNPVWGALARAHYGAARIWPGLFAYQLLTCLTKR